MTEGVRLLFYIEPLPIRDSWTAYQWVGEWWLRLTSRNSWKRDQVRFLANAPTIAALKDYARRLPIPLDDSFFVDVHSDLGTQLKEFGARPWVPFGLSGWRDIIDGRGSFVGSIEAELDRINRDVFSFNAVVVWGLNGAVRSYCRSKGFACIHGELGATRSPLPQSVYFDPRGAHGNGVLAQASSSDAHVSPDVIETIAERVATRAGSRRATSNKRALLALQLADDANMVGIDGFNGPESYLAWALPRLLDAGYEVVVKGHPLAVARAYNHEIQQKCFDAALTLKGVSVMNESPPGERYLPWLSSFDLVTAISSSLAFEASLAGSQVAIECPTSFAFKDAFPRLEQALDSGFNWQAQRDRVVRNAAFYLGQFVFYDIETIGSMLLRTVAFDADRIADPVDATYLSDWSIGLGEERRQTFLERVRALGADLRSN